MKTEIRRIVIDAPGEQPFVIRLQELCHLMQLGGLSVRAMSVVGNDAVLIFQG